MTRNIHSLLFTLLLLNACHNPNSQPDKKSNIQTDTKTAEIQKANWIPNSNFSFESTRFNNDTLFIVTCSEFVYSPFGVLEDKSDIPTSSLNKFNQQTKIQQMDIGEVEFQYLTFNSNRLLFYFDKSIPGNKRSNLFKGEIKDSSVSLINGIRIGMNKVECINTFFESYESKLLSQVRVLALASCVDDIVHSYTFKNDTLHSMNFQTDSYWVVELNSLPENESR